MQQASLLHAGHAQVVCEGASGCIDGRINILQYWKCYVKSSYSYRYTCSSSSKCNSMQSCMQRFQLHDLSGNSCASITDGWP